MARLDKWKEPRRTRVFSIPSSDPDVEAFQKLQWQKLEATGNVKLPSVLDMITIAKELVFDVEDGQPLFYFILPLVDLERFEIEIANLLKEKPDLKRSETEAANDTRKTLAWAAMADVPVYPNTEEVAPELARHYRELVAHGFSINVRGKPRKYKVAQFLAKDVAGIEDVLNLDLTGTHSAAELALVRRVVMEELQKRDEAGRLLASLRLAINDLGEQLHETKANEHNLQRTLTSNPILFGVEYARVIPKHRLGAEYEMDYALERRSGMIDIVEIEASTHTLFTKRGDPTKHLVHAEQQVLDWLAWLDRHGGYAREKLPGLTRPRGYVVIGRAVGLSPRNVERLRLRNATFRDTLQILTYDDLLEGARNLLHILERSAMATDA